MSATGSSDVCICILAIFLPPVAVTLKCGCGADSLINGLLMLLGWLPAVIHALFCISKKIDADEERRFLAASKLDVSPRPSDAAPPVYPPPGPPPMRDAPAFSQ